MNHNVKDGMVCAEFVPQEDITAYDLALVVANLGTISPPKLGVLFPEPQWEELDTRIKRHFIAGWQA